MTSILDNRLLVIAARLVVGSIFLFSSIEKTFDPAAFAILIDNYKLLPSSATLFVATFLPWLELVTGLAIIFGVSFRGASLLVGGMTIVFTLAVISGIARDLDISCGCFTLDPEASKIGWQKVAENVGIIILCGFLVYARTDSWTIVTREPGTSSSH